MTNYKVKLFGWNAETYLEELKKHLIELNDYASVILATKFLQRKEEREVSLVVISVSELGISKATVLSNIIEKAKMMNLNTCTLEMALGFRLMYDEIVSESFNSKGRSPSGALTVVTDKLDESDAFPRGLYLRKIDKKKWLRGFCCSDDYEWQLSDVLVFCEEET